MKRFCLIIPVYNEMDSLPKNLPRAYKEVKKLRGEAIIAEDGSTDGSKEFIKRFSLTHNIKYIMSEKRLGRGRALKNAMRFTDASIIGYMDADLSVDIKYLKKAVKLVEEGNKIVIGSRYKNIKADRTVSRLIASKVYNIMLKLVFNSKISDHQCGFKFFDSSLKNFCRSIESDGWFFDSELLIKAQKNGIPIYELPVKYHESRITRVRPTNIFYFIRKILGLRLKLGSLHKRKTKSLQNMLHT
ncbi:MAG: glycosyltransferase [Candidatus Micrarchaeaceae archaeon]